MEYFSYGDFATPTTQPQRMAMKSISLFVIVLVVFLSSNQSLATTDLPVVQQYVIFQWPGSECRGANRSCCYPKGAKPASDFKIAGLWPFDFSGNQHKNCKAKRGLYPSEILDLSKGLKRDWPSMTCPSKSSASLWAREWQERGTCTGLKAHQYFQTALLLKKQTNLLQILKNAGIDPDGKFYWTRAIHDAVFKGVYNLPGLKCNRDKYGSYQLHQIWLCSNIHTAKIVDCVGMDIESPCPSKVRFPSF